jgi:hypothetical protein
MTDRALMLHARWCGKDVPLVSQDGGGTYLGSTGEEGLLLVVVAVSTGGYLGRVEDRRAGLSWAGENRRTPDVALASLHRQLKRLARAGRIRGG